MALDKLPKDTDTPIQITLKDASGTAIDLDGLSGIVVIVFQERCEFDRFSLNTQTGYGDVVKTDAINGELTVYLNASKTVNGIVGKSVYYEVKTQAVDTNFENSTVEKSTGRVEFATLVNTDLKNVTFA